MDSNYKDKTVVGPLYFKIGIPILTKQHIYIETNPRTLCHEPVSIGGTVFTINAFCATRLLSCILSLVQHGTKVRAHIQDDYVRTAKNCMLSVMMNLQYFFRIFCLWNIVSYDCFITIQLHTVWSKSHTCEQQWLWNDKYKLWRLSRASYSLHQII